METKLKDKMENKVLNGFSNIFTYFNGFRHPEERCNQGVHDRVWTDRNGYKFGMTRAYDPNDTSKPLELLFLNSNDYQTFAITSSFVDNKLFYIDHHTQYPFKSRNFFYKFDITDNPFLKKLCDSLKYAKLSKTDYTTNPVPFNYAHLQYFFLNVLDFYEKNNIRGGEPI